MTELNSYYSRSKPTDTSYLYKERMYDALDLYVVVDAQVTVIYSVPKAVTDYNTATVHV